MGAMYRLKAYFGMVPAEDLIDYAEDADDERYGERRSVRDYVDDGRWPDRHDRDPGRAGWTTRDQEREPAGRFDEDWERPTRPREPRESPTGRPAAVRTEPGRPLGPAPVRGALAVDPESVLRGPVRVPERPPTAVPEQRDRAALAPAQITTLQPRSYNEARAIGERYRDGVPVIMNLTELDDAAAKRLVDFAAGLAFALRGSIDKVTSRVFLLTPADVQVSADDARRIAERGIPG